MPLVCCSAMPRFQVITADQAGPWCDVDRGPFPISTIASSRSTNSITIVAWLQYSARTSASAGQRGQRGQRRQSQRWQSDWAGSGLY